MKLLLEQEAKTLGDWAYLAIAKHSKKILKHEAEVLQDKDPEELHQMRVGMRRLRSAVVGFSLALDLPKNAGQRQVGKVARVLGTLRDIDVLGEALNTEYIPELPDQERKQLEQALSVLSKQRAKALKAVKAILKSQSYKSLKDAFNKWLEQPKYEPIAELPIDNILPDLLLPQVSRLLLHPGWMVGIKFERGEMQLADSLSEIQVESLLKNQGTIIHNLRKEVKRSRYNLELFSQFYGEHYQDYITTIKTIQAVLGEIQDCSVLTQFFVDVFSGNITEQMPQLSAKLRAKRFQKWQEWESLQRQFLEAQTRQDFHLTITTNIKPRDESAL